MLSNLGALDKWSTDQLSGLSTPISTYIQTKLSNTITPVAMTSLKNLLCSLKSSEISSAYISADTFKSSISAPKSLSIANCPNIGLWYQFAKSNPLFSSNTGRQSSSSPVLSSSQVNQLGAVMGGITQADLATLTQGQISQISTSALKLTSQSVLESMSSTQIKGLSATQAQSILDAYPSISISSSLQSIVTPSVSLSSSSGSSSGGSGGGSGSSGGGSSGGGGRGSGRGRGRR